jgi:TIR domain
MTKPKKLKNTNSFGAQVYTRTQRNNGEVATIPQTERSRNRSLARSRSKDIRVFISYASEDKDLVGSIVALLNDAFQFCPLSIYRDVEILEGENYARAIDAALNKSDILLVIFTARMKTSHSWTGYEVGFFQRSIQVQPIGSAGFKRIYIPFCIGAEIPDAMHYIQSISVEKNEAYKVLKTSIEAGVEPVIDEGHPIFKLLTRISDLILKTMGPSPRRGFGQQPRSVKLTSHASVLYRIIHDYLQGRISSETYPERKFVIKTTTRPIAGPNGVDFSGASVEFVGDFSDLGIPLGQTVGRQYAWSEFCDKIPVELRNNFTIGISQLTAAVLKSGGDNYHVVTTSRRDKSFRLFVSKVITYVSQKTDIDIYMVEIKTKEYGDPQTTRLLKAISAGLRFRFLVLEEQSEFRPEKLGHPIVTESELKAKVSEMMGQIDLILKDAADANLYDPEMLILIWGAGQEQKVGDMMKVWERTIGKLSNAAQELLSGKGQFDQTKDAFIEALKSFCKDVQEMNREFTSRVLALLSERVK